MLCSLYYPQRVSSRLFSRPRARGAMAHIDTRAPACRIQSSKQLPGYPIPQLTIMQAAASHIPARGHDRLVLALSPRELLVHFALSGPVEMDPQSLFVRYASMLDDIFQPRGAVEVFGFCRVRRDAIGQALWRMRNQRNYACMTRMRRTWTS